MNISETPVAELMPAVDCIIEGSLIISHQGSILYASSGAACLLGYSEKELLALENSQDIIYGPDRFIYSMWLSETRQAVENNNRSIEIRLLHLDGRVQSYSCKFQTFNGNSNAVALNFLSTETRDFPSDAAQIIALYECSRIVNQEIRKFNNPQKLIQKAASLVNSCGIFDLAWISAVVKKERSSFVWPVIPFAPEIENSQEYQAINDLQTKAINTSKPVIDFTVPPTLFAPDAFTDKMGAFAAVPIIVNGIVYALLNLYKSDGKFFNPKSVKVFESIAGDISNALETESKNSDPLTDASKLKSSEIRLKQAQAIGSTGNFEINFRTGNAIWSEEALRIYGLPIQEKEQSYKNWLSFVHPEDLEAVKNLPFRKADPYDTMFSYRIVRRDGSIRHIAIHYEYEFTEKGRVNGLFGTVHDITNMKAAESALLQSERNLRHIVDCIPQLIYGLDEQGSFIFVNKSFAAFYGKKPMEIIGKQVTDIVSDISESASLLDQDQRILTTGRSKSRELELTNFKNESKTFTTIRVPYARTAIGHNAILGIAYDITNQKKSDTERLLMINDIGSRNRDLEQFSYIVSHNLRSPVANIIGLSEELRNEGHSRNTKEMIMDKLLYSVKLLDQIIIDLNTILEIKGNHSENKETVHFNEVTDNIKTAIMDIITAEEVQIMTHYESAPEIYTLKGYLYSIFQNLISNSIKYSRENIPPIIDIRTLNTGDSIVITYSDNGLGIDLNKRRKDVFGLYKRFHNHKPGKGLGLFMVKTQIEAMGGSIDIHSKPGVGTTFTIVFPV